jgi:hypothetical protein
MPVSIIFILHVFSAITFRACAALFAVAWLALLWQNAGYYYLTWLPYTILFLTSLPLTLMIGSIIGGL